MDDFTSKKLEEWGLGSYINDFKDNRIGETAFRLLTENNIKSVIPGFGDQLIFLNYHSQLSKKSESDGNIFLVSVPHHTDLTATNEEADNVVKPSTSTLVNVDPPTPCIETLALRSVISSTGFGSTLLNLNRKLRDRERRRISEIIINNFLKDDPRLKITKSQYLRWNPLLKAIFPKDNECLWYTPLMKDKEVTIPAQGALLRAYYSFRRECAEANDEEISEEEDDDVVSARNALMVEAAGDLLWLSTHLDPWDIVLEKWLATKEQRKRERSATGYTVTAYIKKYKVIRQPDGYFLLTMDFEHDYQDCTNKLFTGLEQFVTLVLEEFRHQRPMPKELKRLIATQDLAIKSGGKLNSLFILNNLHYLVPAQSVKKTKKAKGPSNAATIKGWRPSKQEIQEGFLTLIDDVSKLQETIDRRDKRLQAVKLTRQPFVILVGKDIDTVEASYVVIDDFNYLMNSPLEALDICFKSVFALSAHYSIESRPIWMLLQTVLYGIKTKFDKKLATPSTLSLLDRFHVTLT